MHAGLSWLLGCMHDGWEIMIARSAGQRPRKKQASHQQEASNREIFYCQYKMSDDLLLLQQLLLLLLAWGQVVWKIDVCNNWVHTYYMRCFFCSSESQQRPFHWLTKSSPIVACLSRRKFRKQEAAQALVRTSTPTLRWFIWYSRSTRARGFPHMFPPTNGINITSSHLLVSIVTASQLPGLRSLRTSRVFCGEKKWEAWQVRRFTFYFSDLHRTKQQSFSHISHRFSSVRNNKTKKVKEEQTRTSY